MVIMENLPNFDPLVTFLFLYGVFSDALAHVPWFKANSVPALVRDFIMGGIKAVMAENTPAIGNHDPGRR